MEDKVSSELYTEFDYETKLKPTLDPNNVVSKFCYKDPPHSPKKDSDGDLEVARKTRNEDFINAIEIEHSKRTALNLVGLQIWRGAFLLCDWLMYCGNTLPGEQILEVASGVGLTSIVASFYKPVICTDINIGGLLDLIKSNIQRNRLAVKHQVNVFELDFMATSIPKHIIDALGNIEVILAADVIYDDRLTTAFIETVKKLLSPPPRRSIYIALEKRYVFTVADFDTCAPCYEYFKEGLLELSDFFVQELPIEFPQFFNYDRVKELVLWKISNRF